MRRFIPFLILFSGCALDSTQSRDVGVDVDVGVAVDGGLDGSACSSDQGPTFALTTLADFCASVSAGEHMQDHDKAAHSAFLCGEPLTEADLPHLPDQIGHLGPASSCTQGEMAARMSRFEASIAAGRMRFDPDAAAGCRRMGEASDGGSPLASATSLVEPCDRVIVGLVPTGASCSYHEECASGYCVPGGIDTCEGLCAPPLQAAILCEPRRDICGASLHCNRAQEGKFRCLANPAPRQVGDSCGNGAPCDANLSCVLPQGVCMAKAGAGEACSAGSQSGAPDCADRCLACGSAGRCVERGRADAPCLRDSDCLDSLECDGTGHCTLRPRTGEPCARDDCLYVDDTCIGGRCTRPLFCPATAMSGPAPTKNPGEPCTSDNECTTGLCTENGRFCAVPCANGCIGNFLSYYSYLLFFAIVVRKRYKRRGCSEAGSST